MAKQVTKVFKIMAPGGKATPAPPIGPALGANGVNPGQFITAFNERTKEANGKIVGCVITGFHLMDDDDCIAPDEAWPMFALRRPNGDRIWIQVSRDEEMNGPGFLLIEEDD